MCSDPSAGPRNRVAGMPITVAGHHREVGHERQLEPADVKERTE
jgi:hypothetical protein